MHMRHIARRLPISMFILAVSIFALTACGSTSSTTTTGGTTLSATSATATACAKLFTGTRTTSTKTAIGTLKSINGQTLVVSTIQGADTTVTYTSSTKFTQEVDIPATSLQEGTAVRVTVTSNGSTYAATSITVTTGSTGLGGFGGGGFGGGFGRGSGTPRAGRGTPGATNPCFSRAGTPGASGTSTTTFRGITGTVSQVNGDLLVIEDSSGASYSVTITAQTQALETKSVTASALKVGQPITAIGTTTTGGSLSATTIAILLNLPTRTRAASTPTP
jgi:hypothetical protein